MVRPNAGGGRFGLLSARWFWVAAGTALAAAAVLAYATRRGPGDPIDQMRREADVVGLRRVVRESREEAKAVQAVDALGYVGAKAGPVIVETVDDPRPAVRERAVVSLIKVSRREHAPRLAQMLRSDPNGPVRATAAKALGEVYACQQMPELLDAMDDKEPAVRKSAEWAVAKICGVEPGYEERDPSKRHQMTVNYYRCYWKALGPKMTEYHQVHNRR